MKEGDIVICVPNIERAYQFRGIRTVESVTDTPAGVTFIKISGFDPDYQGHFELELIPACSALIALEEL